MSAGEEQIFSQSLISAVVAVSNFDFPDGNRHAPCQVGQNSSKVNTGLLEKPFETSYFPFYRY